MRILKLNDPPARKALAEMQRKLSVSGGAAPAESRKKTESVFGRALTPLESVRQIVADVRSEGDAAVFRYARLLDDVELSEADVRLPVAELSSAPGKVSQDFLRAARNAIERVRRFQEHIVQREPAKLTDGGRQIAAKCVPIRRVGAYVPGSSATLPSSVIMNCVPAQVAGVSEIALCTPPDASGKVCPEILACCHLLGIE